MPGSQSARVNETLEREYPQADRAVIAVLLWPLPHATEATLNADIKQVQQAVRGIHGVSLPHEVAALALFATGLVEPIVLPLQVTLSEDQARNAVRTLGSRLGVDKSGSSHVEVHLLGESALWAGLEETAKQQLEKAEIFGFPILLVVLLAIFGSVVTALLPLVVSAVAVVIAGAVIYALSLFLDLSLFTINAASMLGIGIAVDYSLIVLARVRQECQPGRALDDATQKALATSGSAVVFSGITVMASILGVLVVPIGVLRSMAVGVAIIVAVSVAACVTLLPALVTIIGSHRVNANIFAERIHHWRRPEWLSWAQWTQTVTRRPLVSIIVVLCFLLALCVPVMSMRTSTGVLQQLGRTNDTRVGFTEAAEIAGPGVLGPATVVIHASGQAPRMELRREIPRVRQVASRLPHVHRLGPTELARSGSYAEFTVIPAVDPETRTAEDLIQHLRNSLARTLVGTRMSVDVGGATATQLDEIHKIGSSMWKLILAVLAIAFVSLAVLLRSVIVPLQAVLMNLLSVGTAYGVLVIVFQWGWFDSLLNYHSPGHIDTLVPPLLLAIVFGLSTDYEVFLLTRIRERWLASGKSRYAVTEGLAASARTISGAALIIVCVFAVFAATGIPTIKEVGIGASVAIAIDASLIRLILVPAAMALLGDRSWWLPSPLAASPVPRQVAPSSDEIHA